MDSGNNPNFEIYHERQRKLLCGVHALNNLLQKPAFTQSTFDEICEKLTPNKSVWNPHKNPFGLGNYDVNVLMSAMAQYDLQVVWFDRRKSLNSIDFSRVFGIVVNIPCPHKVGALSVPFIEGKHWIAYRKLNSQSYYNLDSKLDSPLFVGDSEQVFLQHMSALLGDNTQAQLLLICTDEVADGKLWCLQIDK